MVAAYRRGTFGTGVVRTNGLALQQSGVVSRGTAATDSNFPNISLLVEPTTTNAATNNTFLDSAGVNTITRNGTPTQGSFTPYWPSGYWSMYGGGSDTLYYNVVNSALTFTGDFTIEGWYNLANFNNASAGGNPGLIGYGTPNWVLVIPGGQYYFYSGGSVILSSTSAVASANVWNHFAVVRSGSAMVIYHNGISVGTATNSSTISIGGGSVTIGSNGLSGTGSITGYMSNVRVVKGTAVYTSAFTPPTSPLTAIANTSFLTCQDNQFKDNSTNALTTTVTGSTPQVRAFQPFATGPAYSASTYGGSGYFDGSSSYLSLTNNAALQFGSGNFTIEAWIYLTATKENAIVARFPFDNANNEWGFQTLSGGTLSFYYSASGTNTQTFVSGGVPTLNAWHHVAAVRSSSTITLYIDGVSVATGSISESIYSGTTTTAIGTYAQSSYPSGYGVLGGYISSLRIVKGTAVYTSAFTLPTTPLTSVAGTSLLLNFANAGIYDAVVQNDIATAGTAQVSTTQYKWAPTSTYFNGTTDYLTIPSNSTNRFGTGNFTIEFWQYYSPITYYQTIINQGYQPSTGIGYIVQTNSSSGGRLAFYSMSAGSATLVASESSGTVNAGTWYHIAIVRNGSTTTIYRNGVSVASGNDSNNYSNTADLIIGSGSNTTPNDIFFKGYLQDLRFTRAARYTANFTPPTAAFPITGISYTPTAPDAPIIANITTITNTSVKIGYMAPLLNGGSTITSYTAVSTPGGITGTSYISRSGTITVSGLVYSNTYTFAVYATNAVGTSTYSASTKSITTPAAQLGKIFILSDMDLALTDLVLLNSTIASGISKAKTYALATIYGSD